MLLVAHCFWLVVCWFGLVLVGWLVCLLACLLVWRLQARNLEDWMVNKRGRPLYVLMAKRSEGWLARMPSKMGTVQKMLVSVALRSEVR